MVLQPLLATDFGNFGLLALAVPVIGVCFLIGVGAVLLRSRGFAVASGVGCFLGAILLFWSSRYANSADAGITGTIALLAILLGGGIIAVTFAREK